MKTFHLSAIKKNRLPETEAEQLRLKVSAALSTAKLSPLNSSAQERKVLNMQQKYSNIAVLPPDKGRCTMVLKTADYHSSYKLKVATCLQKLEREQIIDQALYYTLYPGDVYNSVYR